MDIVKEIVMSVFGLQRCHCQAELLHNMGLLKLRYYEMLTNIIDAGNYTIYDNQDEKEIIKYYIKRRDDVWQFKQI